MERLGRESKKGVGLKTQREKVTGKTSLVTLCSHICAVLRDISRAAKPSNKTPVEAQGEEIFY